MFFANRADLFFAYLMTDMARGVIEDNRREYGDGLKKFEPNDINSSSVIDLAKIDSSTETEILALYNEYRQSEFSNNPDSTIIDEINNVLLEIYT